MSTYDVCPRCHQGWSRPDTWVRELTGGIRIIHNAPADYCPYCNQVQEDLSKLRFVDIPKQAIAHERLKGLADLLLRFPNMRVFLYGEPYHERSHHD